MTDRTDNSPPASANDNADPFSRFDTADPFSRFDTALDELYRLRREVLAHRPRGSSLQQWHEQREALSGLDRAIHFCLSQL